MKEDTEGKALWQKVIKTIKAYNKHKRIVVTEETVPVQKKPVQKNKTSKQKDSPVVEKTPSTKKQPPQLDKSTKRKLTKGEIRPDAKLDLHGMTQSQAHKAFCAFVAKSVKNKKRTLLIITGKGKNFNGVLRKNFPLWLEREELQQHVVAVIPAAQKDGGEGAFYIRLKNSNKNKLID